MILTQGQIQEVLEIIEKQQIAFIAGNIGSDVLTDNDKYILKNAGIDISKLSKEGVIDDAFKWGMLSEALGDNRAKKMTFNEFKRFVSSVNYIPLNSREKATADLFKRQAYSDIKSLGAKMQADVNSALAASARNSIGDKDQFEELLRNESESAVINRKSVRELSSVLREKSKDWNRDMARVADYISHQAFDTGRAVNMIKTEGEDAECYKTVYPGACRHCIRLYLTKGIGSVPKVFKVRDLLANGTNIGRKSKDWKPVLGPTHPWCRCTSHKYEKGTNFDEKSGMFKFGSDYKRKTPRKSKVKITVGGETTEI